MRPRLVYYHPLTYKEMGDLMTLKATARGQGLTAEMQIEAFPLKALQPGHVYFVNQEIHMRGIDYRSEDGIELLICGPLSTERAYI